ncbi:MAG: choice-of-anchor D domain-containing protein [Candidatus Acidiferrum sp.]
MQTKSRTARIALYSVFAVLASVVCFVSSSPSARRWFGSLSERSSSRSGSAKVSSEKAARQAAAAGYANLPLRFEENQGQTARDVRFVSHGSGYELFLTPDEAVLALHPVRPLDLSATHRMAFFRARREARKAAKTAVLRMRLANANPDIKIAGMDRLPGRVDYFLGQDPANWRTNVSSYARVKYAGVYPGVDLVFYGNQRRLEYDFIVAPGADPKAIALNVEGARKLRLNARGDLLASISGGEVELQKPVVYQQIHGERREIAGNYTISGNHRVTFAVSNYDRSEPLVVDPVLIYSTYLGGESDDTGLAIALDSLGDAAVAGSTTSLQFPTTSGAFTPGPLTSNANGLVFVTQMDPTGTHQLYSSYVGGSGGDFGLSVAYDSTGNIYVTGETDSTDFPTTTNALKPGPNAGNTNGTSFVFEINPAASGAASLVYSSYLGGTQGGANITEFGNGIATDSTGAVYVVGLTGSQPGTALANFPVTASAFQTTPDPSSTSGTAFVSKLNTTLSGSASLIYSSYLSGNGADSAGPGYGDEALGVAEDSTGNTYIVGSTSSTNFPTTTASVSFPAVRTAFQTTAPAAVAAGTVFVARFDTTQSGAASLLYSSYLGGEAADFGDAIAVGPSNVTYLTGSTSSLMFPTTTGAFQTTGNANSVAFITLLDTSMNGSAGLKYSTFLGGSQTNTAFCIAADATGNAYVGGETQGADFPVTPGALEPTPATGSSGEGYVTKLNPGGHGAADLVYSTYFGGDGTGGADEVNGITLNPATDYGYITGQTFSSASTFPVAPNPGAFQPALNGPSDAFVAELTFLPTLAVSPTSLTFGPQLVGTTTPAQTVTLTNNNITAIAFTSVTVTGGSPAAADTDFSSPSNTCGTSIAAGASCTINVVFTPSVAAVEAANLVIADGDSSSPQTVTLSGTGTNVALTVAPTSLAFGSQPVGTATAPRMVTLTNGSTAAIAFTSAIVSGGSPAAANTDFTATTTCGSSIAASSSCTINVVFNPSVAAAETANLVITDGAPSSPQTVTLTGTGTSTVAASFTVTASPTTLAVAQGASGTFKVTVTPAGGFNQAVALACTGAPANSTCTAAPTSVTPTDGVTPVSATVTVATTAPSVVTPPSTTPDPPLFLWRTVPILLAFSLLLFLARQQRFAVRLGMAAAMAAFLALAGCSGGHHTPTGGTPMGTSTLTVTGTSGKLTGSATVSLTVN